MRESGGWFTLPLLQWTRIGWFRRLVTSLITWAIESMGMVLPFLCAGMRMR